MAAVASLKSVDVRGVANQFVGARGGCNRGKLIGGRPDDPLELEVSYPDGIVGHRSEDPRRGILIEFFSAR